MIFSLAQALAALSKDDSSLLAVTDGWMGVILQVSSWHPPALLSLV